MGGWQGSKLAQDLVWFSEAKSNAILLHQLPVLLRPLAPHRKGVDVLVIASAYGRISKLKALTSGGTAHADPSDVNCGDAVGVPYSGLDSSPVPTLPQPASELYFYTKWSPTL